MVVKIKKMTKRLLFPLLLIITLFNFGCSPAGMLATGGSGALVVAEGERSMGTVIDDATIIPYLNPVAKAMRDAVQKLTEVGFDEQVESFANNENIDG